MILISCLRWTVRTCASCGNWRDGERRRAKVRLLREFDPRAATARSWRSPTPTTAPPGGFDEVLDLVQAACAGLLARIDAGEEV